jgi:hypothetical protein
MFANGAGTDQIVLRVPQFALAPVRIALSVHGHLLVQGLGEEMKHQVMGCDRRDCGPFTAIGGCVLCALRV